MKTDIAGRIALVTGGSKGIGRRVSEMLAEEGCKVAVVARDQAAIDETVNGIVAAGGQAIGISADLTVVENYQVAVDACKAAFGAPEIAVYNMTAPDPGGFEDVNDDDFRQAYHLVQICYINMVRAVLPGMQAAGWGRVVTIGSGTAKAPLRSTPYFSYVLANAHRAGAVGLNKTLAVDYGHHGITFNTVGVGAIATEQAKQWIAARAEESGVTYDEVFDGFFANNPVKRAGQPDEVAAMVVYLSSNLSGYTTGETILCDGGMAECFP